MNFDDTDIDFENQWDHINATDLTDLAFGSTNGAYSCNHYFETTGELAQNPTKNELRSYLLGLKYLSH